MLSKYLITYVIIMNTIMYPLWDSYCLEYPIKHNKIHQNLDYIWMFSLCWMLKKYFCRLA